MTRDKLASVNLILLEYSLYCFVISYPYSVKWANGSMLAIFFFAMLSSSLMSKIERLKADNGLMILPAYFILLSIGVLYSNDVTYGLSNLERSISFFCAPLLLGTGDRISKKILIRAGWILTINTLLAALYCLLRNVFYFKENDITFKRFFDWEYTYEHLADFIQLHPTYFSILVLISIYMIIFQTSYESTVQKVRNMALIVFLFMFLILLGAKIAVLVLFLFVNIALITYLKKKGSLALVLGYVLVNAGMIAVAFNTHVIYWRFRMAYETFKNTWNGSEMSDYRLLHWKCTARAISEKPIFGWGTGDSYIPLDECYEGLKMNELLGYNAHNQFLEAWIKLGLPGLLMACLCLFYPLIISIRNRHYLFISIFSTYTLIALTESIFSVQKGIALYCLVTSIYLGHVYTSNKDHLKGV